MTRVFKRIRQRRSEEQQGWIERITQRVHSVLVPQVVFPDCMQHCHPPAIRLFDLLVVSVFAIQDVLEGVLCMLHVWFPAGMEPCVNYI